MKLKSSAKKNYENKEKMLNKLNKALEEKQKIFVNAKKSLIQDFNNQRRK